MSVEAIIRKLEAQCAQNAKENAALRVMLAEVAKRSRSITEEIDAIPGRRIVYTLSGDQSFTSSQDGVRGQAISFLVSQDGPFVMTHYPFIGWYPNAPATADNYGRWMPIKSTPLPTQQNGTNYDWIDVSYEIVDGGSQRNFQNLVVSPGLVSTADNMIPLPVPTLFQPNTTIQVYITYNNIVFSTGPSVDTTGGNLHVDLPGYRIVQA